MGHSPSGVPILQHSPWGCPCIRDFCVPHSLWTYTSLGAGPPWEAIPLWAYLTLKEPQSLQGSTCFSMGLPWAAVSFRGFPTPEWVPLFHFSCLFSKHISSHLSSRFSSYASYSWQLRPVFLKRTVCVPGLFKFWHTLGCFRPGSGTGELLAPSYKGYLAHQNTKAGVLLTQDIN